MVNQADLQELMSTGLKYYLHDPFLSSGHISNSISQTAAVAEDLALLRLSTGVQQGSVAQAYYDRNFMNPLYGKLLVKLRLSTMEDVRMFLGFKYGLTAPTWGMTESCAGLYIDNVNDNGVLYFYTGNGDPDHPDHQETPVLDIDMTRWLVFEIEGYRMRWYSLPYTVPYFDKNVLPGLKQGMIRKWSNIYTNGSRLPDDVVHYLMMYIENGTGFNKYMEVQFINYAEVYPD